VIEENGSIIRKNDIKEIFLLCSADEFREGLDHVINVLSKTGSGGSFFFT